MDRREALKKMAAGGAAFVGGSAILTSPAFAFTAPTPPADPGLTVTGGTSAGATVTITGGTATCPSSATGTSVVSITATFTTFNVSGANRRLNLNSNNNDMATPRTVGPTAPPLTATVIKTNAGGNQEVFATDDAFDVEMTIVYRCTYPGGVRETTATFTRRATWNGTAWVITTP